MGCQCAVAPYAERNVPRCVVPNRRRSSLQRPSATNSSASSVAIRPHSNLPCAQIVLAAAAGANNCQIARQVDVSLDMVRRWRQRWLVCQAATLEDLPLTERLTDAPRPGAPARIRDEQVAKIVALACEPPADTDRPISQWTGREIADEIKKGALLPRFQDATRRAC